MSYAALHEDQARDRFRRSLLSTRALIGWVVPPPPSRPAMEPLYEFGGGLPDPASFPHDAMLEATARMLREDGDDAMTYGEAQGYLGLRELVCHKYELFEGLEVSPDNILIANGSGNALSLAFSTFVRHRRPDHHRGADVLGHAQHDPPPRRRDPRRARGRRRHRHQRRARGAGEAAGRGQALQADLHDRQLPEPVRPDDVARAPQGAGGAGRRVRHADPGRRRLRRAALRGAAAAVAVRAGPERPHDPGRHALEDPGRWRPARLALRARRR